MPQMGESIAEGTIVRWIKKVGDAVDRDEPLFEISTDKVDAEIPSPVSGFVLDISVKEGETVPVNSVVAMIGEQGEAGADGPCGCGARACCGTLALRPTVWPQRAPAAAPAPAAGGTGRGLGRGRQPPPRASVSARRRSCGASRRNTTSTCRGLPARASAAG